jgi:(p)ppGpp synthase/HD superfamily hydrolase
MTKDYAKEFATKIHEGQFRADGVTPFISHPARVAELVERNGGDECAVCVAWLHDVFEEGIPRVEQEWHVPVKSKRDVFKYVTQYDRRWDDVYLSVLKLTDTWDQKEIERNGKVWYLSQLLLTTSSLALTVKLCDMLANIEESNGSRISQEKRYLKAVRVLLAAERNDMNMHQVTLCHSIIDMVERHMSHRPLESVQHLT